MKRSSRSPARKAAPPRRPRPPPAPPADQKPAPPRPSFPVVGIGASAGGLAAFEAFFSGMPTGAEPDMAFVLVQHLAPDHKSLLTELIQRATRMRVSEVVDGMVVEANCVYIIPPDRDMALLNGTLQLLEPRAPRGQRLPIDFFFRTLAQDQGPRAICVVLSGTGSDGTQGLRAIKEAGGMAMAQTPATTEYDGMPSAAIATGLVDFVLPPAEMPPRLIAFAARAIGRAGAREGGDRPPLASAPLQKLFVLLRSQTGHDFSQYKLGTVQRRVERRMAVHQLDSVETYVRYAERTPTEVGALFRDLLINVTSFFRDPEAFRALGERLLPKLLAQRPAGAAVRVWCAGCSTGEEAYSLAIALAECQLRLKRSFKVKIFATDIDAQAIAQGRAGVYPASIAADLTPERLTRYFTVESDGGYRVVKSLRDTLVFSEQDLIKDPPFSRLDLITCRNVLIYLGAELQRRLLPLFHYALNPGGLLFLGTSESVGDLDGLFATQDRKLKLYRRDRDGGGKALAAPGPGAVATPRRSAPGLPSLPTAAPLSLRAVTEQALLEQLGSTGALVDQRGDILYLHGRVGRYLEPSAGEAKTSNILRMAREGLRPALARALRQAGAEHGVVKVTGVRVKTNGGFTPVDLTIGPAGAPGAGTSPRPLYLVILQDGVAEAERRPRRPALTSDRGRDRAAAEAEATIASLTQELLAKDQHLQSTVEEQETTNEELRSSNEEMQSVNEELQSANEELETSKEELQSVNEELATVNSELQAKVSELSQSNNDMTNLIAGTGIGTIFVDHHLNILRFSPTATQVINLIPGDVGRPLTHIVSNLVGYQRLPEDVRAVLETLVPRQVEVGTHGGAWFLLRIRPYRTLENEIKGAVITFTDISELKKLQDAQRLAVVVRDAHDAITLQDLEGRTLAWNGAATRLYGWSETEALAMSAVDRIPGECRVEYRALLARLARLETSPPQRTRRLTRDGRSVEVELLASALVSEAGEVYAVATTERASSRPEGAAR